jgi:hypothetical protein
MRKALQELTAKGHSVLPRSVGDSVTVNGETVTLTAAQQKKLRKVYGIGQEAVADMVKLKQFGEADAKVQAAAVKFIWDVYWDLALEAALGLDLAEKNVLFAEAIDIEKLAIIIATARAIEADKDKSGKAISGTKKRKVQTFVNSLRLSAAEKYMVMGYLGYTNANGKGQVEGYISTLKLTKAEKKALRKKKLESLPPIPDMISLFLNIIKVLFSGLFKKFHFHVERLRIKVGGADAAQIALVYVAITNGLHPVFAFLDKVSNLHGVNKADIEISTDYLSEDIVADVKLGFSTSIGGVLGAVIKVAWKALVGWIKISPKPKSQEPQNPDKTLTVNKENTEKVPEIQQSGASRA